MTTFARVGVAGFVMLALFASASQAVIKATSPLKLFVRDATQIVQVKITRFDAENKKLVFEVEQDLSGKLEQRSLPTVWKLEPDSKWEGIRSLPDLIKCLGPDQQAILFINDTGGFWHNKGNVRKNPIAFGFSEGSWFCLESARQENGKLVWQLA